MKYKSDAKKGFVPERERRWIAARQKFRLSHGHIQMARELGMNPDSFGKLANQKQEPWKVPLPEFIEQLYFERFGKTRPDSIRSIEEIVQERQKKKAAKKESKRLRGNSDSVPF